MYQRFYGITKNPFSLTPDTSFLVMTEAHCEVKAGLTYAILAGKGFTVLTGEAGTGKTTLLRSVINSLPIEQIRFSLLVNPVVTPDEFYELLLGEFGLPEGKTKPERRRILLEFLVESRAAGQRCVLFVDEAHCLSVEMLEEIRLLTNFETEFEKLLQIVLAGQDELNELLDRRQLRQLKQRIEVRQHIGPLAPEEVPIYICHRWKSAGGSAAPFSSKAIRLIGQVSGGIPRLINIICDNALLLGFAQGELMITETHIAEVRRDLRLERDGLSEGTQCEAVLKNEIFPSGMPLRIPPPAARLYGNTPSSDAEQLGPDRNWRRFVRAVKA